MKKFILPLALLFVVSFSNVHSQVNNLSSYASEVLYDQNQKPTFIQFKSTVNIQEHTVENFINSVVLAKDGFKAVLVKEETDQLGFTHLRFNLQFNFISLAYKQIVAHCKNGILVSLNGDLSNFSNPTNSFVLNESECLQQALAKVNAAKYKWQNKAEEQHMREVLGKPDFSFYPKGEKVLFEKNGTTLFAYCFEIYAEEPLYKAKVLVDASSGKIVDEQNMICNVNTPATALTKYSGTQTITCDYTGTTYRLRETQRGLGVETYNCATSTTQINTDFTNATTSWTSVINDQVARDAHWGAEKTYDYYFTQHNRNSIDNAGQKLLSYVHYSTNYNNAFWDGLAMTYGDGNSSQGYKPFTALDVCGHEITHGLTSNTGNLNYSNESGALNESFSDIFGTVIENYARPGNWNWKMGEDLTTSGNGLRHMGLPNSFQDPDTYLGTYWYTGTADNGGVHTNSGVGNYWFYLLATGGSGVNDISNSYNVNAIALSSAARIAFRALTVYFTPTTNYAQARALTIQAAKDIFGNCSNEVIQTTNAWYAVGVGSQYVSGVIGANFISNVTSFCSIPALVTFSNTTINGLNYTWNFGDGGTSTTTSPVHTYTANGTYHVKLKATGCGNGLDSITKNSYIVINVPNAPTVSGGVACENDSMALLANGNATIKWYSSPTSTVVLGTGNSFYTPTLAATAFFYAANTVTYASAVGGRLSNANGGMLSNTAQYMIFDVIQNCTLNSVVVYANSAGLRTFELRNSSSAVLSSTSVNLTVGANTVILNYILQPASNYQLGLSATSNCDLYRSNSGNTYPYNVNSCIDITNSNAGVSFYYWFYRWEVTRGDCSSARVVVTASVSPSVPVSVSAASTLVCLDDNSFPLTTSPSGGMLVGNGLNGSNFMPSTGVGTYTIGYSVTDMYGCNSNSELNIQVDICEGLKQLSNATASYKVFPNPSKQFITIKAESAFESSSVLISDALGRLLYQDKMLSNEHYVDVKHLAQGMYTIKLIGANGVLLGSTKLIKE